MNRFLLGGFRAAELLVFSVLILATRCANYQDVFVNGEIYFSDADCYARMTRARMCLEHPGLIIRHHSFENFPAGTAPHTTAPFDYLIVALAAALKPFTVRALDLAGAIISPLLGLAAGWFLWWWARRSGLRYRGALLLLYALSPILVHGTELGRPDHQSLLILLVLVAICAEWTLQNEASRQWSIVSGAAWGLALWVSLYEPLILVSIVLISHAISARRNFWLPHRRLGWVVLGAIVLLGFVIERRFMVWPLPETNAIFANWIGTIGELRPVPVNDPIWLRWTGLLLVPAPALLWLAFRKRNAIPLFLLALLLATFALTIWQARWAYFFVAIFALLQPALLGAVTNRAIAWIFIGISLLPVLRDWDETLWPNESQNALRLERRREAMDWRAAATSLASKDETPFLAPWWLSPAVAYWSGQPGVAGSSHEALDGIARSARFFLAADPETAREILRSSNVAWVLVYDADRTVANSSALLGVPPPPNPLGRVLDRAPGQAPSFLQLVSQNGACKVFRAENFHEKEDLPR
ncbi:MAG TPA: hypothetical protein VN921_04450 [Chthoniobacterales bacterium]|nr:hypothetical protein [Chthoniobacterales bacterium]